MLKSKQWLKLLTILILFCLNVPASAKIVPVSSFVTTSNTAADYFVISSENVREFKAIKDQRDYLLSGTDQGQRRIFIGAGLGFNSAMVLGGYLF